MGLFSIFCFEPIGAREKAASLAGRRLFRLGAGLASTGGGVREAVALELFAQRGFQDLAGRGVGMPSTKATSSASTIWRSSIHEFQDVFAARFLVLLELDDQQRTLVPLRMIDADHGGFGDRGMADGEVFQVDRRNPLAADLMTSLERSVIRM